VYHGRRRLRKDRVIVIDTTTEEHLEDRWISNGLFSRLTGVFSR
jgi:hypothetical protein